MLEGVPVITSGQRRAICQVFTPGPGRRGTAFLVANNRVMTAAHVVASANEMVPHPMADIQLIFGNPDGQPVTVRGVKVSPHFDPLADWAVLELPDDAPALNARPFRLREPAIQDGLQWNTFGYSTIAPDHGQEYGGEIVTDSGLFQLRVDPTQGSPSGLSGSPCLVDGEVIGVIVRSPQNQVTDTLYARSMLGIDRACTDARAAVAPTWRVLPKSAPYAAYVTDRIRPFEKDLWATAAALGLASTREEAQKIFVKARLPGRVALEMMTGTEATLTSIRALKRALKDVKDEAPAEVARDLLERAAKVWIDSGAVQQLRQALDDQQLVILNTDSVHVVGWYLHRLNWMEDVSEPERYARAFCVDPSAPRHDVVLRAFEDAVLRELGQGHPSAKAALANHRHDDEPIVAWFRGLPEPRTVDALRDPNGGYEQVRLLFMVGTQTPAQLQAEYPNSVILTPPPLPTDVERALAALEDGLDRVRRLFEAKGSAA